MELFITGVIIVALGMALAVANVVRAMGAVLNADPFDAFWNAFKRQALLMIIIIIGGAMALIGLAQLVT